MRFGCCGNMVATGPDKTGIEIIEKIAALGYDYVELPLAEMMDLDAAAFSALKKRVGDTGLTCEVCNNFFPARIRLTGPDADMVKITEYVKAALFRAASLGVKTVVFGSGGAKSVPQGFPYDEAFMQVADICRIIDPIAGSHNITIAIEPIRTPECNIITTFGEGVKLARLVDMPNTMVLVDSYHMTWENEPVSILYEEGKRWLRHVHFSNPNLSVPHRRIFPADINEYDYAPFITALKDIDYCGRVSVEAYTDDFDSAAAAAIKMMRASFN